MPNPIAGGLLRFAAQLRFPTLFMITGGLFLLDVIIPDFIPLADELLLGLLTLLLANLRRKPAGADPIQPL